MSLLYRLLGLIFAGAVGYGLYYFWPTVWSQIRGPSVNHLQYLIMLAYAIGGLWIAEKIWGLVDRFWQRPENAG